MRITYLLLSAALLLMSATVLAALANAPACHLSPKAVAALNQAGAARYFLKLDGIAGCSTDSGHPGWIQFEDYSFYTIKPGRGLLSETPVGASSGSRPYFTLAKPTDASSPALREAMATGRVFNTATVDVSRGGVQPRRVVLLRDVKVERVRDLGPVGNQVSLEEVTLSYGSLSWQYPGLRGPAPAAGVHTRRLLPTNRIGTTPPEWWSW